MNVQPGRTAPAPVYEEAYYRDPFKPVPYERNDYWLQIFQGIADHIVRSLRPRRVLDAGCAKGFLVEALWERGVDTRGIDISAYAIGEVRKDIQPYCTQASLTEPIDGRFDLVTCIEVLEHVADTDTSRVLRNLTAVSDTILFSSTPIDTSEPTHLNVRPVIEWLRLFANDGFAPDVTFDASFIAPHAFLVRRSERRVSDDVLVLFAELIRYRMTLGDHHRQLDHFRYEMAALKAASRSAERRIAALGEQVTTLHARVTHDEPPVDLGGDIREIRNLLEAHSSRLTELTQVADAMQMATDRLALRLGSVTSLPAEDPLAGLRTTFAWRALRAGRNAVRSPLTALRRLVGAVAGARGAGHASSTLAPDLLGLVCDSPTAAEQYGHAAPITIRGWALALKGRVRLDISIEGRHLETTTGGLRPDVARSFPHVPHADRAGFSAELAPRTLPIGLHTLRLRAVDDEGASRELSVPLRIMHDDGITTEYDRWIVEFERRNESLISLKLATLPLTPLVSILLPVHRAPLDALQRAIESVTRQSYAHWQLCVVDDGSESVEIHRLLTSFARKDSRIAVQFLEHNGGISHASNAALEMATGDYVGLLDHDDELSRDALFHMVEAINQRPDVDVLYSDEDKIDERGRRYDPFFKPDWSPDLLLSENYICHFLVARRALVNEVGRFRSAFDGSQDYDLILRLTRVATTVAHVPRILYHWRSLPSSAASSLVQKPDAIDAAGRAIQAHLDHTHPGVAHVVPGCAPGRWRVRYALPEPPPVSIVIASGGRTDVLRDNLESLLARTAYAPFEAVVIDNSSGSAVKELVKAWPQPVRYLDWRGQPFNYAAINNEAARRCTSPYLLFLNDDTIVTAPGWLEAMMELAVRPEVGAVGARLLYPDGRIQHAGVILGVYDNCGHAFKGLPGDREHYFDLTGVIRNVSAVTGACLLVRASLFHEVQGFDSQAFPVAFNDVDLCLKIGQRGYRVLYTPHAQLFHHESMSKTPADLVPNSREVLAMQTKWSEAIAADPFYNPNLTRTSEHYGFRRKA